MTGTLTPHMLALIAFCVFTETAREVCFKYSADNEALAAALIKPVTWLGVIFWALELVGWTIVLEHVPLSIAFPLMALSYVIIVLAGAWIFKEQINLRHAAGVLFITAGVACVGATGL
ncbi:MULTISPECIES: EamA family transporter [unclassified Phyllobacterium]|uniref:EamA family transporter n=1 Tax=Phyllobacterium TaxID=28100 RepID=UPI000DD70F4F|nr:MULTISPECIES: EamA family transporter [unclassified Phyllobacterium]MBA8902624.1 undecaprenyl phosphate-alpha-L-ara4N flippase subunit ArnE [Phyllobacterium sp. P30BS-XVII]UGX87401.1 EamA family transporter [Phyllobacterium sp. T1293]